MELNPNMQANMNEQTVLDKTLHYLDNYDDYYDHLIIEIGVS